MMVRKGDVNKQVWVLEFGWTTDTVHPDRAFYAVTRSSRASTSSGLRVCQGELVAVGRPDVRLEPAGPDLDGGQRAVVLEHHRHGRHASARLHGDPTARTTAPSPNNSLAVRCALALLELLDVPPHLAERRHVDSRE